VRFLFADGQVNHRYDKDNNEEDNCRRARLAVIRLRKRFVDEAYHREQILRHRVAEDTDDARILLETADEACDDDVCNHRRKHRNGNSPEHSPLGGAVDFCRVVILFIYALQTAEQNQNLEGQRIPYDIDDKDGHFRPIAVRADTVYPVDGFSAKLHNDAVDKAVGLNKVGEHKVAYDVKERRKDHTDSNRVGYVGQEENRLEEFLQGLDCIQANGNKQRKHRGEGDGDYRQQQGGFQCRFKLIPRRQNRLEVFKTKGEGVAADVAHTVIVVQKRHTDGIDDRPYGKDCKQNDCGQEIEPSLPLVKSFVRKVYTKSFPNPRNAKDLPYPLHAKGLPYAFNEKVFYASEKCTHGYTSK